MSYNITRDDVLNALNAEAGSSHGTLQAIPVSCDTCRSALSNLLNVSISSAISAYAVGGWPSPFIAMLASILTITVEEVRERIEEVDQTADAIVRWLCQQLGACQ